MKKIYTIALLITGMAIGAYAGWDKIAKAAGHLSEREVKPQLRTIRTDYSVPAIATLADASVTAGTAGVIHSRTVNGLSGGVLTAAVPTIQGPYPAKLKVKLIDPSADSTLVCTAVTIYGRNQFGQSISETVALPNETEVKTTKVFEFVSSYSGTGCTGGTAAEDVIRVRVSNEVGLPFPITSENALLSVCVYDLSAVATLCYAQATFVTDLTAMSLDFDNGLVTLAVSDRMIFGIRPPAGL